MAQRPLMCRAQHDARRFACIKGFLPARCAEAPTVARFQTGESESRHGCRKIIAAGFGEFQELGRHDHADGVATEILCACIAAAIAEKTRHRTDGTYLQPATKHVQGRKTFSWSTPVLAIVMQRHEFNPEIVAS